MKVFDVEPFRGEVLMVADDLFEEYLTREEAVDLMVDIASAIQMSGDMCDPLTVELHEFMVEFKKRFGELDKKK